MSDETIHKNTEKWYLKYIHQIIIYMNFGFISCASILDSYLIKNSHRNICLTIAYDKTESTLKMTLLMLFLSVTLVLNWLVFVIGKLSPLCYILHQTDEDFI